MPSPATPRRSRDRGARRRALAVGSASLAAVAVLGATSAVVQTMDPTAAADRSTAAASGRGLGVATTARANPSGPVVTVRGAVRDPLRLSRADLDALPQHTETVSYTAAGVPVTATFTGPLLLDVLDAAGPRFDPAVKNDALRFAALATGADGYQAVVAWGEIDPGFEGKQVLLATTQDGVPLTRPRLVVPGDAKGGRYVSDVVRLKLVDLGG